MKDANAFFIPKFILFLIPIHEFQIFILKKWFLKYKHKNIRPKRVEYFVYA
ncbi:MAG: hypothetical protein RL329_4001 [Bacteroidota bacterium]|jgi:hypothetical protein